MNYTDDGHLGPFANLGWAASHHDCRDGKDFVMFQLQSRMISSLNYNGNLSGFSSGSSGYGQYTINLSQTASTVPEPATLAILGMGLLGFAATRRKSGKNGQA